MSRTTRHFDVTVKRKMDGHKITTVHHHLTAAEVMILKAEEQCLPGFVTFEQVDSPRPWDTPAPD